VFAGKKSAQIREILISESAWEEMTCLFAPSLGQLLSTNVRLTDRAYRFGGEEFIILQECQSQQNYAAIIQRMMTLIRSHPFIIPEGSISITVTCGTTLVTEDESLQTLIDRADKAMYFGKQQGRNQCRFWTENKMINIEKRAPWAVT